MRHRDSFISQSLKNIRTSVNKSRTSAYLNKEISKHFICTESQNIILLSAGDESLILQILKKMNPGSRLILLEADPAIGKILNDIKDERLTVIPLDVLGVTDPFIPAAIGLVDYIISAIPLDLLPEEHAIHSIQTYYDQLKQGGKFIQVQYSSAAKKIYEKIFGLVQMKFLPFHIPPAFLLIMSKSITLVDCDKS